MEPNGDDCDGEDECDSNDYAGDVVVGNDVEQLGPTKFTLQQNYPNPFNPITEIRFDIPEVTKVDISIFNLMGQKVKTLKNEK